MKRVIAFVMCLILVAAFAGCGQGSADGTTTSNGSGEAVKEPINTTTRPYSDALRAGDFSAISGEYHLTKFVLNGKDTTDVIQELMDQGVFDEYIIIYENGQVDMFTLNRQSDPDAEPELASSVMMEYDPETDTFTLEEEETGEQTLYVAGDVIILESASYHLEFEKR